MVPAGDTGRGRKRSHGLKATISTSSLEMGISGSKRLQLCPMYAIDAKIDLRVN